MSARTISDSVVVPAEPAEIFELLANPRRHPELDGSGTVKGTVRGPNRLYKGAQFGMRMRVGVPYVIKNTVVEFDENRRIAWRHFARHIWRYELEPAPGGGTKVTETFDWGPSRSPKVVELLGFPKANQRGITATLERLRTRFADAASRTVGT